MAWGPYGFKHPPANHRGHRVPQPALDPARNLPYRMGRRKPCRPMFDLSADPPPETTCCDAPASAPTEKKPVLIVLHQEQSNPGRVGRLLRAQGHRLDVRRPRFGDPLPKTLRGHAAAVIFGGPMSANDPDAFIKAEI